MPTIGWIDALRTYNAGMPSWCVPRKGTPGYERVMRIRQGEQTKGFKEVLEDLERKTSGKPKKEKKSLAIDLAEPSKQVQEVKVPTIAEGVGSVKTDRSTKKMSSSNNKKAMASKAMKNVYFHKDKTEYTLWRLDADTFTQLGDWNSHKTARGKPGFVKTSARKRKTTDGGQSYTTPKDKKNMWVRPLAELPSVPSRLQSEVVSGLEELGYTKDIKFDETPTEAEIAQEEAHAGLSTSTTTTKPKDSDEVMKLKAIRKELKAKLDAIDVNKNSTAFYKALDEVKAVESKIRKAAKEGSKEDSELPPLLSGKKDGEENSKHLAVLQEAAKEGRLYQLHGITRRGTVETPVFLRQGNDYHKIAVIALGRTTFPEEPHSVYFQPITRRIVLTEKEAKAKGMAKFHSKI